MNETLDFYAANAATYVTDGAVNPRLAAFLALLPPGGRVLELGTGSGADAGAMLAAGFDVDPTDGSLELAAEAEKRLGRPVRHLLFQALDAEAEYDGIYASATLLHARRSEMPEVIARLCRALKPGGVLWASFKGGGAAGLDSLGRYYNYLDAGELRALWSGAGWTGLAIESWQGSGYDRQPTEWHAVTVRKQG